MYERRAALPAFCLFFYYYLISGQEMRLFTDDGRRHLEIYN